MKQLYSVAYISCRGNEEIGKMVANWDRRSRCLKNRSTFQGGARLVKATIVRGCFDLVVIWTNFV